MQNRLSIQQIRKNYIADSQVLQNLKYRPYCDSTLSKLKFCHFVIIIELGEKTISSFLLKGYENQHDIHKALFAEMCKINS